ncbi:hypothetical protein [Pasteurella oralis]|uniref:hypothetical protein n=1 Tax=Pasteurella oralis TaxID=1071947 RepID=UPI000C7B9BEA|nr:hypothetical protein [Pasteurella oralis]
MEQTKGKKLVGITFNVENRDDVHECKKYFAAAIDQLEECRKIAQQCGTLNVEKEMFLDEAEKRIIDAQMWAVKAITYGV